MAVKLLAVPQKLPNRPTSSVALTISAQVNSAEVRTELRSYISAIEIGFALKTNVGVCH